MPRTAGNLIAWMAQRGINPARLARWLGVRVPDLRDDLVITSEMVAKLREASKRNWKE